MKKPAYFLMIFLVFSSGIFSKEGFLKIGGLDEDLYSVAISPFDSKLIFVGSGDSVFESKDGGKSFRRIFTVKGEFKKVNYILFDPYQYEKVYLATDSGLYLTSDLGKSFSKIFKAQDEEGNYIKCLSLAKKKNIIYLGTDEGLYQGEEDIYKFKRVQIIPEQACVYDIEIAGEGILLATSKGVYSGKVNTLNFKRVFVGKSAKENSLSVMC